MESRSKLYRRLRLALGAVFVAVLAYLVYALAVPASNDRDWVPEQAVLARAEIQGSRVIVHNVRNFRYRSDSDYDPGYYGAEFDLEDLERVWFIVVPFGEGSRLAHTFLSFEFSGDRFLAISIEIRKEKGEQYSPLLGMFRQFEIMYVIADERDVVQLRSNVWKDPVFVYPIRSEPEARRDLLLDMLRHANELYDHPQWYHTIVRNCTTSIRQHVERISPGRIPRSYEVLINGLSDALAYEVGLIDTTLAFEAARARFRINERAMKFAGAEDFPRRIREE